MHIYNKQIIIKCIIKYIIIRDAKGYCFHLPVNRTHLPVNYRLTDKQHKSFHDEC